MVSSSRQVLFVIAVSLGLFAAVGAGIAVRNWILAPPIGGTVSDSSYSAREVNNLKPSVDVAAQTLLLIPNDFSETVKLIDPNPANAVQMGFSVAISGDTAIVGAPGKANNRGSAFICVRSGNTWTLQQEITGTDSTSDDHFGWSVSISGETAVVGAYDLNENDLGAAYVFVRNGLTWTQQQKITPTGGAVTDQFGSTVSISGETLLVGAFGKDNSRGAAYVYTRSAGLWTQQQILIAGDGVAGDEFGWSLAISGERAILGAPGDDSFRGGAYLFVRNGTSWSQTAKITSTDGSSFDRFGYSVAVDGSYALIGAPQDSESGIITGSGYVFAESGGAWQQQKRILANDRAANDKFGSSVAILGLSAVIGANGDDVGTNIDQGSAYVFTRNGGDWTQAQKILGLDGLPGDNLGVSVGLAPGVLIVGSYLDDISTFLDSGSAYTYTAPAPATVIVSGRILTPSGVGLRSAQVRITDVNLGTDTSTTTSTLGYFQFQVTAGRDYVINVNSKRYRFSTSPITVTGDVTNIELVGLE